MSELLETLTEGIAKKLKSEVKVDKANSQVSHTLINNISKSILNYWRGNIPKPNIDEAYSILMDLANNSNSLNCGYQRDVHDAQIRQVLTNETIPFKTHEIPGVINMSDYDMGRSGYAY